MKTKLVEVPVFAEADEESFTLQRLQVILEEQLKSFRNVAKVLEHFKPEDGSVELSIVGGEAILYVKDLAGLRKARRFLKTTFPEYTDKLDSIISLGDTGVALYRTNIAGVTLRLRAPVKDFPIKRKGCGFREEEVNYKAGKTWVWSCSGKREAAE
ncbi:MAG TPA: hypothetical protein P5224_12085 [Mesotoga sp.]|nr:hypothetical protein [Mesotoga sp.]